MVGRAGHPPSSTASGTLAPLWHTLAHKLPRTAKEVMEGGYWRIKPPFTLFTKLPKYLFSVKMIEKCKITSSFMRNYFVKIRSNEKVMHESCKIVLNLVISPFAPVLFLSHLVRECSFPSNHIHERSDNRYYNPTHIHRYIWVANFLIRWIEQPNSQMLFYIT